MPALNDSDLLAFIEVQDSAITDLKTKKTIVASAGCTVKDGTISFDGSALGLGLDGFTTAISLDNYTAEAWVCIDGDGKNCQIHYLGDAGPPFNCLWIETDADGALWFTVSKETPSTGDGAKGPVVPPGQWMHIAATLAPDPTQSGKGIALLYINGIQCGTGSVRLCGSIARAGHKLGGWNVKMAGRVSGLRIYKRTLTPEDIREDMISDVDATGLDKMLVADLEAGNLVDFKLRNRFGGQSDGQSVLYTRLPTQSLDLEIYNTSRGVMTIAAPKAAFNSNTDAYFYLTFRPGTLWNSKLTLPAGTNDNDKWTLTPDLLRNDKCFGYYLCPKQDVQTQPFGEPITLQIADIQVDGRGGSRSTLVELRYAGLSSTGFSKPLKSSCLNYLAIMDEMPAQLPANAPIVIGWNGSNAVLNDGTETTLVLRFTSQSDTPLVLVEDAAKIRFHFPDQSQPWGLVKQAGVNTQTGSVNVDYEHPVGGSRAWKLSTNPKQAPPGASTVEITPTHDPKNAKDNTITLKKGDFVEIPVTIATKAPPGTTLISVSYEGFSGLSDTVEVSVVKSSLVFGDLGTSHQDPLKFGKEEVTVKEGIRLPTGWGLLLRGGNDYFHGLMYRTGVNNSLDGPMLHGFNGGVLSATQHDDTIKFNKAEFVNRDVLRWTGQGRVGIGTNDPQSTLDVAGGLTVSENVKIGTDTLKSSLTVSGSVGIGTNAPKSTLDVSGSLAIGDYSGKNPAPTKGLIVSGNVGIGTADPKFALDVAGMVRLGSKSLPFTFMAACIVRADGTFYQGKDFFTQDSKMKYPKGDSVKVEDGVYRLKLADSSMDSCIPFAVATICRIPVGDGTEWKNGWEDNVIRVQPRSGIVEVLVWTPGDKPDASKLDDTSFSLLVFGSPSS